MDDFYAVILAGGAGTRFWPMSRQRVPKQLQRLFGKRTLLEMSLDRVERVVKRENIVILSSVQQRDAVWEVVKGRLQQDQVIAEPARRDTAAAVALGAAWVALRNKDATFAVLPSDHLVEDEIGFATSLKGALMLAEQQSALLTIGIEPSWACPSFGYIERGKKLSGTGELGVEVNEVERFREKPDEETAKQFLASGRFVWNAGMFAWSLRSLGHELEAQAPELYQFMRAAAESEQGFERALSTEFERLKATSVDYALLEGAERVLCVAATFDWDDVGGWPAVAERLPKDDHQNAYRGEYTAIDSSENVVFSASGRRIALIGVQGFLVVETEDSVLVVPRSRVDEIKQLVAELPAELR